LMGTGQVVTVDVERQHSVTHPRITFLMGSSTDPAVVEQVKARATEAKGSVMVILDSDHSRAHVLRELALYAPLVTLHSYCLVQDGIIDQLAVFRRGRPGPLRALEQFLRSHPDFVVDADKCQRFLVTHHPKGWLKRIAWRGAE
jgi:cephalosporin hydroxylase